METEHKEVTEWLSQYSNPRTESEMRNRFNQFLKANEISVEDLIKLSSKECKHLILKWQKQQVKKGSANNTILGISTAPRAFFSYLEKPMKFSRGQLLKLQKAKNKYKLGNGDIRSLFEIAPLREKCIISLATSLGWAISDILALEKQFIESLLAKNEDFVYFETQRIKTDVTTYAVLNPIAQTWLRKWLAKGIQGRMIEVTVRGKTKKVETLFDIEADMINKQLQKLAKEAQLNLGGKHFSFHCFRGWVFSGLIRSGFSSYEARLLVGKKIPLDADAYLALEESIEEKYQVAYPKYFQFDTNTVLTKAKDEEIADLKEQVKTQRGILIALIGRKKLTKALAGTIKHSGEPLSDKELLEAYAKSL